MTVASLVPQEEPVNPRKEVKPWNAPLLNSCMEVKQVSGFSDT